MKRFLFTCIVILSAILFAEEIKATHLIGGNLSYEYIGQNDDGTYRYRIYSTTYTNCDGNTSNVPEPEPVIPVGIYTVDSADPEGDKVLFLSFDMPLVSTDTVSVQLNADCGIGQEVCVAQGDYEFFVDLDLNFGGYWLYYDRCCRNNEVINVELQQGVGFMTFIPSPLVENSSPFFSSAPASFICVGDTATFLNSAIDPDGDVMLFSFIQPFAGYSDAGNPNPGSPGILQWPVPTVDYNPGYDVNNPLGPNGYAFINGATGLTQYVAPETGQYSVAVEIKEYRNGNLIAITRRDLQLLALACPVQEPPTLNTASQNLGTTQFEVEEGDEICIPVIFSDPEGDSLSFASVGEVFDMNLVNPVATISEPMPSDSVIQADFCWTTTCDQGRATPYFFSVTATDNGCPPKQASAVYTIEVIPFSGSSTIDGETNPCEQGVYNYSTNSFPPGSTYQWVVGGGTIENGQGTNNIDVEWAASGVGTLTVIATNEKGCVGDPFDLNVAIQALPTVDAGNDISICLGDTVSIGGAPTGPLGSFYTWGPDTEIENSSVANPSVFPSSSTEFEVVVSSAANCTVRDTVVVTVNVPAISVSEDIGICEGESTILNVSGGVDYSWTPSSTLTGAETSSPTASPTLTTMYVVDAIDANMCAIRDSVLVTVSATPVAVAGADAVICGLELDMTAIASVGTGTWTSLPATLNFSSLNDANATATAPSEGVYQLIWEEVNDVCVDSDTLNIEFIEQPVAQISNDPLVCGLSVTGDAGLPGDITGTGSWCLGPNYDDPSDPQTGISVPDYGDYWLCWTETNSICSDTDSLLVSFLEQPSADAGLSDSICGPTYALSGNAGVGIGTWTGANIAFDDENDPSATATSSAFGAQILTWSIDNGGCTDSETVEITFFEQPLADAGEDITICGLSADINATQSVGVGMWSSNTTGIAILDNLSADTQAESLSSGIAELIWMEDTGQCTDQDTITVTFLDVPVAEAGADLTLCIGSDINLSASGGDTYSWSPDTNLDDAMIANPMANPESSITYFVTVGLANGCEAEDSVLVDVVPLPIVSAGEDISYLCLGDQAQLMATAGFNSYLWSPNLGLSSNTISNPTVSPASQVEIDYVVTVTDANSCVNTDTVNVVVNPIVPTEAGEDMIICAGESVSLGGAPTSPDGTSYAWTGGDFDDPSSSNPSVSPTQTTTYTVTTSNSICNGVDAVTVNVEQDPGLSFDYVTNPGCEGLEIRLQNTSFSDLEFSWDFGDGTSSTEEAPVHTYPFGESYELTLIGNSDLNCLFNVSDSILALDFLEYFEVMTPNVMTPNGDGENDYLEINVQGNVSQCLQFEIFNRWGQKMFISTGNNTRWDGRTPSGELVSAGVYFYFINLDGLEYKGSVTVIR